MRVVLTRLLKPEEHLQFAVATGVGPDGKPRYGNWIDPAELTVERTESNGQVRYVARNLTNSEGPVWIKARILPTGTPSGEGRGNAREMDTPLRFTLDKTAPGQVQLNMADNRDDGASNQDGISSQTQITLQPLVPFEDGAEVHLRLLNGTGTDAGTLQLVRPNGEREPVVHGNWIRWQKGDQLQLIGETLRGNGKARIQVRQLDQAGNFTDTTQTFIADSIFGTDQLSTLTLTNAALKTLPVARTNTIAALRNIVAAAARVAALADGIPGNSAESALPSATDYSTLGVSTPLSAAGARVTGQVIDDKGLNEVATTALLESIAAAAQRVTQHAAGNNLPTPLAPQDFSALGIRGVTTDNVARMAAALREVPASLRDNHTVDGVVDTLAEIRAIVALDLAACCRRRPAKPICASNTASTMARGPPSASPSRASRMATATATRTCACVAATAPATSAKPAMSSDSHSIHKHRPNLRRLAWGPIPATSGPMASPTMVSWCRARRRANSM